MGLFDKLKKVAQEQLGDSVADYLQKQADEMKYTMKHGGLAALKPHQKELEEMKAEEEAKRQAKIEAERKAKEEAERKAREEAERKKREETERREAERKAREDAALEESRLEEARLAQIEANRQRQAELDRKEFEDAKRKAQMEAELRAMKEAEEKAQEDARQQKLAKKQEEKQNILASIKDYVEKAENGDGQAACQIGLWFQHGQKGLPQDTQQAKYWYQQAMVLGNQNAATFLNILVENEQNEIKAAQKQEELKAQEEDDNRLRLQYDTEDEFLANEKNDGEAAYRIAKSIEKGIYVSHDPTVNELKSAIENIEKYVKYLKIAKIYNKEEDSFALEAFITSGQILKKNYENWIEAIEDCKEERRQALREEARKQQQEDSMVEVYFEYDGHNKDSSYTQRCHGRKRMPREEYYSLIQASQATIEGYVKQNIENYFEICTNVSMSAK